MNRIIILFAAITIFVSCAVGNGESNVRFILLPSGHHFAPLKANIYEPRIGVFKFLDAAEMKVDIGNSIDVAGVEFTSSQSKVTIGIDFMAYALTTGAQGLRLQVDALDGFFGGNLSFSKKLDLGDLQARFRILHHSAHFADGHYQLGSKKWIGNREPIPYTQDFGELVIAHNHSFQTADICYYGGISYATLVRPAEIQRFSYLAGCEIYLPQIIGKILEQPTNIFCAYNISIMGRQFYSASNQIQLGIKFGKWNEKGVTVFLGYYNGQHMFGEYYDLNLSTIGAGFTVDFF
jgi:hypothetical protein